MASVTTLATPGGTRRYEERMRGIVAPGHFRTWPGSIENDDAEGTLRLSSFGMGSYTGALTQEADAIAVATVTNAKRCPSMDATCMPLWQGPTTGMSTTSRQACSPGSPMQSMMSAFAPRACASMA